MSTLGFKRRRHHTKVDIVRTLPFCGELYYKQNNYKRHCGVYLNGVLEGSNRALCLRRAGPGAAVSSWEKVTMYLEGGPPKSSSLFCSTCSQHCRVFRAAWHSGEPTGRSKRGAQRGDASCVYACVDSKGGTDIQTEKPHYQSC